MRCSSGSYSWAAEYVYRRIKESMINIDSALNKGEGYLWPGCIVIAFLSLPSSMQRGRTPCSGFFLSTLVSFLDAFLFTISVVQGR